MKDSHGRVIDYLRISLTDRCNFRCIYCMPAEGVQPMGHDEILRIEEIEAIARVATRIGIRSVRLTGGEPLVRKGVVDLVKSLSTMPSLDTLDPEQFTYITRVGRLESTLKGIDAALAAGFNPVKINAVTVRRLNQDFLGFAKLSLERPLHVRFIEYMPVGSAAGTDGSGWDKTDVIPSEELLEIINDRAIDEGIPVLEPIDGEHKPIGWGPARYFEFPGAAGTVGFISPLSRHFCSECNRLRLTADGKLRPCLFSDREVDVRAALRDGGEDAAYECFLEALNLKPDEHHDKVGTERNMSQIGG